MPRATGQVTRRWRDYRTAGGRRPVKDYLDALADDDAAEVAAALADVRANGTRVARHLRGDVYEVRASGRDNDYRIFFAAEGRRSQVLLALHAMAKHTQKTPDGDIRLAERRLRDWRDRGGAARDPRGRGAR